MIRKSFPLSLVAAFLTGVGGLQAIPTTVGGIDRTASYDIGSGGKPYAIIQLGNNGGAPNSSGSGSGGDKLEITSNSSVFGSTLKGV